MKTILLLLFLSSCCTCKESSYIYYQNDSLFHANLELKEWIENLTDTIK